MLETLVAKDSDQRHENYNFRFCTSIAVDEAIDSEGGFGEGHGGGWKCGYKKMVHITCQNM